MSRQERIINGFNGSTPPDGQKYSMREIKKWSLKESAASFANAEAYRASLTPEQKDLLRRAAEIYRQGGTRVEMIKGRRTLVPNISPADKEKAGLLIARVNTSPQTGR